MKIFDNLSINLQFSLYLVLGWIWGWLSFLGQPWQTQEALANFNQLLLDLLIVAVLIEFCWKSKRVCKFFHLKSKQANGIFYTDFMAHMKCMVLFCCALVGAYYLMEFIGVNTFFLKKIAAFGLYLSFATLATIGHYVIKKFTH